MARLEYISHWSLAERTAARLDGELTMSHLLSDAVDDHHARSARALGSYVDRLVLTGISAVWALGVSEEPGTHHVSQSGVRIKLPQSSDFVVEQRAFRPGDTWGSVTSPRRTAIDLLRATAGFDPRIVRRLMQMYDLSAEYLKAHLNTLGTTPGRRLATDRLALLVTEQDRIAD
jgi:hypothetical protein